MALKPDDLVCYAAAAMPEDETSPCGGVISTVRLDWGNVLDQRYQVSGCPGDASVAFTVRMVSGHRVTLTQVGGGTFDFGPGFGPNDTVVEILKVISSKGFAEGGTIGSLTVGVPIITFHNNDTGITECFIGAFANNEFGGAKTYYNKIFWKNTSPTDTLQNALVQQQKIQIINPKDLISFSVVPTKNDLSGTANRLTGPDQTIFSSQDTRVPSGFMQPGDHIGVWLSMHLDPNLSPGGFVYKSQCTGQTAATP